MKISEAGTASVLANSDIQLAIRLCGAVAVGRLTQRDAVLARLVKRVNGKYTIAGKYLPFLRLLLESEHQRSENILWLKRILERQKLLKIADRVVLEFLAHQYKRLTA